MKNPAENNNSAKSRTDSDNNMTASVNQSKATEEDVSAESKKFAALKKIGQYLVELCCVYTFVSVGGAVVNILAGTETNNANVLVMFATCAIATFVLFLHKLFDSISPLLMMVLQYLIACALIGGMLLLLSILIEPISPKGWFEYFRSFTIPYIFLAGLYYYRVFSETKKQDRLIHEIQEQAEE